MAAWVEDKDGNVVKDLGATRFTATGGFLRRKEALPLWVAKTHPENMKSADVDAIAQATPQPGKQTIMWDGALDVTDEFTEDTAQNRDMITNVQMTVHRK